MNASDEVLSAQCSVGVTTLNKGFYTCVITGPLGVILEFGMDMARRDATKMVLDDEELRELLVVSSIVNGWIEVMLHERQQRDEKRRAGVPALPSQSLPVSESPSLHEEVMP